jgi:hypothetical protein
MTTALREELLAELEGLSDGNLRALLQVPRGIRDDAEPIRRWSPAVGSLSDEDAEQMRRAIEEGCEGVDPDEWTVPTPPPAEA